MTATLTWGDIVLRLGLTLVAGLLIGVDRGEHAQPAGLRTTMLIAVAACVAMLQANALMAHMPDMHNGSFSLDMMRIPEGILSGVGFLGAGAILRRGETVRGITTAATIWLMTVIGLCFGGGQLGLGCAGTLIAVLALRAMRSVEEGFLAGRRGKLTVTFGDGGADEAVVLDVLRMHGFKLQARQVEQGRDGAVCVTCNGRYRGAYPAWSSQLMHDLAGRAGIRAVRWSDID